jgi:hypothetical protein
MSQLNMDSGSITYGITCCERSLFEVIYVLEVLYREIHLIPGMAVNENHVLILAATAMNIYGTSIYVTGALLIAGAYINARIKQGREAFMEAASQSPIREFWCVVENT